MGHRTTGTIARAFLLSEARALEGKVTIPVLIPPTPEIIAASPDTFANFFRVRIDPKKAQDTDKVVQFVFTGKENKAVALHVRRGVAEYIPTPADYYRQPDFVVELGAESWAALYLGSTDLEKAVAAGKAKVTKGNQADVVGLFDLFDKLVPTRD